MGSFAVRFGKWEKSNTDIILKYLMPRQVPLHKPNICSRLVKIFVCNITVGLLPSTGSSAFTYSVALFGHVLVLVTPKTHSNPTKRRLIVHQINFQALREIFFGKSWEKLLASRLAILIVSYSYSSYEFQLNRKL